MCNNENPTTMAANSLLPLQYGHLQNYAALPSPNAAAALEHYRLQLYNYAYVDRFRFHPSLSQPFIAAYNHENSAFLSAAYLKFDPRCAYRVPEEPKPQHSYIGLIGMAILSSAEKKLVLSDIYQYILDNYAYFRTRGPGWRNSIRHNLSLNDCFIKAGRSANGKGHYWAIHPANVEDFKKGDFRRRKAQRRVRKHMGLAVPEDDDSPSSTPPPNVPNLASNLATLPKMVNGSAGSLSEMANLQTGNMSGGNLQQKISNIPSPNRSSMPNLGISTTSGVDNPPVSSTSGLKRKRLFDVESLLAPDRPEKEPDVEISEVEEPISLVVQDEGCSGTSRKCSPDTTAESPWSGPWRNGEMSKWHEAVSRLLIRAQQQQQQQQQIQQQMVNGNKMIKLSEI